MRVLLNRALPEPADARWRDLQRLLLDPQGIHELRNYLVVHLEGRRVLPD